MKTKVITQLDRIENLLTIQKNIFTMAELSRYTELSKSTLYKLTSARKIPFSCPNGKTLFFNKSEIDRWLLSNPAPTADQINAAAINHVTMNPNTIGGATL